MLRPNGLIQCIINFHKEVFTRIKKNWQETLNTLKEADKEGQLYISPSFESLCKFCSYRTVMYTDIDGEIIYTDNNARVNDGHVVV